MRQLRHRTIEIAQERTRVGREKKRKGEGARAKNLLRSLGTEFLATVNARVTAYYMCACTRLPVMPHNKRLGTTIGPLLRCLLLFYLSLIRFFFLSFHSLHPLLLSPLPPISRPCGLLRKTSSCCVQDERRATRETIILRIYRT